MDDRRFDDLARALATGPASRRGMLRLLGGGALAGLFAALRTEEAAAACRLVGQSCSRKNPDKQCCAGARCVRAAGGGRVCECKPGRKDCDGNGRCETDILTDPNNCGDCDNVCPTVLKPVNGELVPTQKCFHGACACYLGYNQAACPQGCTCANRKQGENSVCASTTNACGGDVCETDADCPVGSVCMEPCTTPGPRTCSQPCT